MRRPLVVSGVLAGLGAVPLVIVLLVATGQRSRALDAYILFLGGLLMLALARGTAATAGARRSVVDPPTAHASEAARLPELARIEREVVLSTGSEFDQHLRVKPLLRDIATHRLRSRHGIDLDEQPVQARELIGDQAWELVRPGPLDPNKRYWKGLDLGGLQGVVDRIEQV